MHIKITTKNVNYLLIIGIVLAPMTGLRIGKVGPAELLVLIWCLIHTRKYLNLNIKNHHFLFSISFLFCVAIGTTIGILFYPQQTIPVQLFTWLYLMFISIGIYVGLKKMSIYEVEKILNTIAVYGTLWNMLLYFYSIFVSTTFLSAPLWYGAVRFSGGGTNPHQISVFLSAIIFMNFRNLLRLKSKKNKVKYSLLILSGLFLASETQSSTLTMAIFITFMVALLFLIVKKYNNKKNQYIVLIILILIAFYSIIFNFEKILKYIFAWIESDPNGVGRLQIFSTIGDTVSKSFLFGLGPGTHAFGGAIEYHNTYLEILAMSGITGFLIFSLYSIKLFKTIKIDYTLILIILPLYIYGFAGFAMRRLVYWAILMMVIVVAEKLEKGKKTI